jgi:hypothetical protein
MTNVLPVGWLSFARDGKLMGQACQNNNTEYPENSTVNLTYIKVKYLLVLLLLFWNFNLVLFK